MIHVKNQDEIQRMRVACQITRDTLNLLEEKIRPGMTTKELDRIAYDYITKCGAKPAFLGLYGFPGTCCISIDEEVVHGFPSDRVIKEGEIVSVDVGAFKDGFNGDAARTFCIGEVTFEKRRLVEVTKQCFFEGIKDICVGSAIGDIGYQVQTYAESNGFSVVRDMTGHGIGRKLHEEPELRNYGKRGTGIRLKEGMTLALEPMINMGGGQVDIDGWKWVTRDGLPSAHYENTFVVTANGVEILTL